MIINFSTISGTLSFLVPPWPHVKGTNLTHVKGVRDSVDGRSRLICPLPSPKKINDEVTRETMLRKTNRLLIGLELACKIIGELGYFQLCQNPLKLWLWLLFLLTLFFFKNVSSKLNIELII